MAKIRRAIKVWGAQMEDGSMVTNDDPQIVSVTIHPDGSVHTLDPAGKEAVAEGTWVTYNPRFN
ncbi:MAG: hypothetical protein DIZ78_13775 [endosymbiont of Escarpia spicata]|uniref:Uncharacterized protein n=1 Tax=endosymbiont of Escarpia spicata TaxID=2200908 RepID=A0A370DG98_9GAMM|nr:hypothetical protein [gamma proteobacterium endosymbiont of Lamellibrachia anaximandri]MBL3598866.1 hypothetical protein [gamma proteobacterium endosymbiont of Lamellibrachia anaximandri]MBL3618439.1 hypothetical protein [gamma proteobacterium endosymbiont of Lamellibrachia anaximandri]RDH83580.1 MAG: hypothetical protein DIZ78_13775 [endosymbiont of Escarpia spicata]